MKAFLTSILILPCLKAAALTLTSDTTISGTWDLHGKILHISAKISGKCTIRNALIEANPLFRYSTQPYHYQAVVDTRVSGHVVWRITQ